MQTYDVGVGSGLSQIDTPFGEEAQAIIGLIRKRASDDEMQISIDAIHKAAEEQGMSDVLLLSTDAFVTCICHIGSKSLSHVLSCIERCKERLLAIGGQSEAARKQIISSVMEYWHDQPGIGVNIIDKLLNYTILTPMSVIEWVLLDHNGAGSVLAQSYLYEMVSLTVYKVTNRVRQIVVARNQPGLPAPQVQMLDETLQRERAEQTNMFRVMEEALVAFAQGNKDELMESGDGNGGEERLIREWAERWLRVFRRKIAVEEAMISEVSEVKVDEMTAEATIDDGANGE